MSALTLERMAGGGLQGVFPNFALKPALEYGVQQLIASKKMFGWDGVRFDWNFLPAAPQDPLQVQEAAAGGAADFGHLDHKVVIQNMIDAVRKDVPILIPVPSVRHTVEIVLGMYHSAARKTPIDLPVKDDPTVWDM